MTTTPHLLARLGASRAALLAALEGLTDREFGTEIEPGLTVIAALARLAPAEREAVDAARAAAGLPPRPRPIAAGALLTRAVPPQVIHDLAGARHETLTFLARLSAPSAPGRHEAALGLLDAVAAREEAAARRIGTVPRGGGAVSTPSIQQPGASTPGV